MSTSPHGRSAAFGRGRHARQDRGDQRAEIFAAVTECGQHHLEAGEARVEILTEPATGDPRRKILVGRRDDADVDLDGIIGSDRENVAFLEDTEQGGL
jgi:hypothetical protein